MSLVIVFKEELNDSNVKTMTTFLIDKERMNKTLAKGFVQQGGVAVSYIWWGLIFITGLLLKVCMKNKPTAKMIVK